MTLHRLMRTALMGGIVVTLTACGVIGSGGSGFFGNRGGNTVPSDATAQRKQAADAQRAAIGNKPTGDSFDSPAFENIGNDQAEGGGLFDLFGKSNDPNTKVAVNKYIWNATLEVLNFLPVQSIDPFTGVIVTGFGVPPGGGTSYRATVLVQDPALDARSLKLALQTRGGTPVSRETARAVEDAILTRARQLRIRDSKL
jgi:hypothetical protein